MFIIVSIYLERKCGHHIIVYIDWDSCLYQPVLHSSLFVAGTDWPAVTFRKRLFSLIHSDPSVQFSTQVCCVCTLDHMCFSILPAHSISCSSSEQVSSSLACRWLLRLNYRLKTMIRLLFSLILSLCSFYMSYLWGMVVGFGLCGHNENKSNAVAEQEEVCLVALGSISNQLLHYSTGPGQQPSNTYTHFGFLIHKFSPSILYPEARFTPHA